MNVFSALAQPLADRPGDPMPEPPRAPKLSVVPRPMVQQPVAPANPWGLTLRQCTMLRLSARGLSSKEIARELGLSFKTVEIHKQLARKLMGVHKMTAAIALWLQHESGAEAKPLMPAGIPAAALVVRLDCDPPLRLVPITVFEVV